MIMVLLGPGVAYVVIANRMTAKYFHLQYGLISVIAEFGTDHILQWDLHAAGLFSHW